MLAWYTPQLFEDETHMFFWKISKLLPDYTELFIVTTVRNSYLREMFYLLLF
jgi:hypothetical protein